MAQRILLVDDERDIRQLVAIILEAEGYQVAQACSGVEALEVLASTPYDLVILDLMMPVMDGWEVCRQIKNHPQTQHVPVLLLTVRNQPLDRVIGLEVVHADDFITKPFERQVLLQRVQQLLMAHALAG